MSWLGSHRRAIIDLHNQIPEGIALVIAPIAVGFTYDNGLVRAAIVIPAIECIVPFIIIAPEVTHSGIWEVTHCVFYLSG